MSPSDQRGGSRPLTIGGVTVAPGERRTIQIPIADLATHAPMTMPVQVVRGLEDGPRLFVCGAIHGDEINGVEIVSRLLAREALGRIRGTLIAVPIVNVLGFVAQSRYLPDRRDLNRCFPGSPRGSLAARVADLFLTEIVGHATHGIDLHTGAIHRGNYPQIRANLADPETERLARAFNAPVLIDSSIREGSLRGAAAERGVPVLVYEAGEALRFDEVAIERGVAGVLGVMAALGMLPGAPAGSGEAFVARSSIWIRAPRSGVLRECVPLGRTVERGEVLGVIADSFGGGRREVRARVPGIVIGCSFLPVVYEGDALFHVVRHEGEQCDALALDVPAADTAYEEAEEELRMQDAGLTSG